MSTSLLDRVALNQTRLRTPGLSLDGKGVALGAKGLVLLPSLDRLVTMLALYTSEASLESLVPSLGIDVVKSSLGHREVVIAFNVDGTERLDSVAETARLAGGFTFTGTSRQFVQYRDAGAPFGYDVRELTPTDAALTLNHSRFQQTYAVERSVALSDLLLKLEPRLAPEMSPEQASRCWILADSGLGAALIHYFVRSRVDANVGILEIGISKAEHCDGAMQMPFEFLQLERSRGEETPSDHVVKNDSGEDQQQGAADGGKPSAWPGQPAGQCQAGLHGNAPDWRAKPWASRARVRTYQSM